jgi:predicted secreted protein
VIPSLKWALHFYVGIRNILGAVRNHEARIVTHQEGKNDKSTALDVELGKTFHLMVEANPSTGYVWDPRFDSTFLDLLGEEFGRTSNAIGAGGTMEFSFLPIRAGKTRIVLHLKRPWESEIVQTREFEIEIV